jgi:ATP-binding cassette subfamily F protein uup
VLFRSKEKRKLSYKETRELEELPQKIEALEEEKQTLIAALSSPAFYARRDMVQTRETNDRLTSLEKELDERYRRWDELENMAARFNG